MDPSESSFPPEEPFEDPKGLGGDMESIPGDDFDAEFDGLVSDEGAIRGWIPPDDRLWVHPSEMGRESRIQELDGARKRARRSDRRGLFAAGVVGTAALTAAVAAVALAASSSSPIAAPSPLLTHPTHFTNSVTNSTLSSDVEKPAAPVEQFCAEWMSLPSCRAIQRLQPSMFKIVVQNGQNSNEGTAVVVPDSYETIAITAASLVGNASSVTGFESGGRPRQLKVLGVDSKSGIAVVRVPWAIPAAPIAEEALSVGQILILTCMSGSSTTPVPGTGQVDDPDTSGEQMMDAIDVDVTKSVTPGALLLDPAGNMIGLMGATEAGDSIGEFVPAWLAVGVAQKIATESRVVHGWLDVKGMTNSSGGAKIVVVPAKGPAAAAGIKPGDVVVGLMTAGVVDPILSMADLEGRLYLEPPGARVELQVVRGGENLTFSPVLAASLP
jgi:serine protease Do